MKRGRKITTKIKRLKALSRAAGVAAAVVVVVSGVTFAALQSQQSKLVGNVISTATANLQLSVDGGMNFGNVLPGYNFVNLIPGGQPMPQPGQSVMAKNIGTAPLDLKMSVSNNPTNPDNVDLTKVMVIVTSTGGSPQSFSLKSLIDANSSGGVALTTPTPLFVGNRQNFNIQVAIAADAVSSASASLGTFDLAFSGVAVPNN